MRNKRKRNSVASFVQYLDPSSNSAIPSSPRHNLSAYHPHLEISTLDTPSFSEYNSLITHCLVHPSQFPPNLVKYWRHRFSLFSLYSQGCLLDQQSWYSVTPECVAYRIAKRCATDGVVVDLFAGAGGNAIQFAMTCARVIAIEKDELKMRLAKWNAKVYGVDDRILFICGDSIQFLNKLIQWRSRSNENKSNKNENANPEQAELVKQNDDDDDDDDDDDQKEANDDVWNGITSADLENVQVVFLSPPWGGVDYAQPLLSTINTATTADQINSSTNYYNPQSSSLYHLSSIQPIHGNKLFKIVHSAFNTPNIAYYLPRNTNLASLSNLSDHVFEFEQQAKEKEFSPNSASQMQESNQTLDNRIKVKVEYQYVNYGAKLSSLTAYYGRLANDWNDELDDWRR
ncbi:related to TGS1 - trimethyl guanosine synthase [Melanopsichium pennsylvanicum]|uniref:Trimethylguanosine synthase n=2 Tax=Melanopsichium pennsylvanicum TaxID=63383 RepID=A0AAJ4XIF9_9BASI